MPLPRGRVFSPEQMERIRERLVAGELCRVIADEHGCPTSTIDYHRRRLGIESPRTLERARRAAERAALERASPTSGVALSDAVSAEARRLHSMGRRHTEIAALLRIPHRSVAEAIEQCPSAAAVL